MRPIPLLALLAALLFAGPVLAQGTPAPGGPADPAPGLYQTPGANSPKTKEEVQLYNPAQDQVMGRVSIPDYKAGVLVQPEGRDWREFRTSTLRIVAAVLILGTIALLAVFFFMRGTIEIAGGRSGRTFPRFGSVDRFAHWMTAISFIVLGLTGLAVTFGRPVLIPLFGHSAFSTIAEASKYLHNFFSIPFVLGLLLMLVLWVRDNIPEKADVQWVRTMGGLLGHGEHPECGRFNAGQKGIFWGVILGGSALAVTGFLMMMPFGVTGISGMQILHVIHAMLAALLIAMIIAHIYIGSIGMEGAFDAMGTGRVDENWIKDHHRGWYNAEVKRMRGETANMDRRAAE